MKKTMAVVLATMFVMLLTACGADKTAADVDYSLNEELAGLETRYADLTDKMACGDMTQTDMTDTAKAMYDLWDEAENLMNDRLVEWTGDKAAETQQQWTADREQAMREAGAPYEGGSLQPMVMYEKGAKLTRAHVYELAAQLGQLVGQPVDDMPIQYEGDYLDTRGGQEIYSELVISAVGDNGYPVQMHLCDEKIVLQGNAAMQDDGTLAFTDAAQGVSGAIAVTDEAAQFTVTEAQSSDLHAGDTFDFPEKAS